LVKAQTWKTEDQYIQKFAPYAVEEMEKYKIPASITLAQGLLETEVDKADWHWKEKPFRNQM
jgi:flagellum-specific peptidoglycan hydrolase FlgJ